MTAARANTTDLTTPPSPEPEAEAIGPHAGIDLYRLLTDRNPEEVHVSSDDDFDRHVLASILAVAAMDGGSLVERTGLSEHDLKKLLANHFPMAPFSAFTWTPTSIYETDNETAMVRDLLLARRSTSGDVGYWLATMVARRIIEPNHLWEDLGLRQRTELSRLLTRHFAPLANRNTDNLRWKRFFYRVLCEDDGFGLCVAPVCTQCNDFNHCFGEESGEGRMVDHRLPRRHGAAIATTA